MMEILNFFRTVNGLIEAHKEKLDREEFLKEIEDSKFVEINTTEFVEAVKKELVNESLTCKNCRGLSVPVLGTPQPGVRHPTYVASD